MILALKLKQLHGTSDRVRFMQMCSYVCFEPHKATNTSVFRLTDRRSRQLRSHACRVLDTKLTAPITLQ